MSGNKVASVEEEGDRDNEKDEKIFHICYYSRKHGKGFDILL